ncbi:hypothetical protein SRHO_G00135010 [Serrasalmus rhombeus]
MDPVTPPPPRPSQWGTLSFDIGDGATGQTTSTLGHRMSHNRSTEQKRIEASRPPRAFVRYVIRAYCLSLWKKRLHYREVLKVSGFPPFFAELLQYFRMKRVGRGVIL